MRDEIDAQEAAEREERKRQYKGIKGKLKLIGEMRKKKEAPAQEEPQTEDAAAEEETTSAAMAEPGTAPAKEMTDEKVDKLEELDKDSDADTEEGEADSEKPKKAKEVPGSKPTEDVLDPNYFIKRSQSYANQKDFQSALNYVDRALELGCVVSEGVGVSARRL
jgi:hypothetical protein